MHLADSRFKPFALRYCRNSRNLHHSILEVIHHFNHCQYLLQLSMCTSYSFGSFQQSFSRR